MGISRLRGAIPAIPVPLLVRAKIVPVTCVPWPTTSVTSVVLNVSLRGETTVTPARSG